ncbi:MAG: hypothetical protein KGJ80_07450 [Chloroflexota bacterium]|nr:hypothetical protein [Chloroflexota bacterium]
MELLVAAAFLVGLLVGMFLGTLVLSLCAIAGREDRSFDPVLAPSAK